MITLGIENWDRGLSGHGQRGHKRARHDYNYYQRRTDDRHYGPAYHYDRNAFLNINHVWTVDDYTDKPDTGGHWSNFVLPQGHGAPGYSSRNDAGVYNGRNQEDNKPGNDFRKHQSGYVLYNGIGKPPKDFNDNAQGKTWNFYQINFFLSSFLSFFLSFFLSYWMDLSPLASHIG